MANAAIRISINNIYGGGDYTGTILVGSENAPANVILDTGSSTLAVKVGSYNPTKDGNLKATQYAQDITYGTGGWAGPVVNTSVGMGTAGNSVALPNAPIAITSVQEANNFGIADGIMGLAYTQLNDSYDMTSYLQRRRINPPVTYPWPIHLGHSDQAIGQFQQMLSQLPVNPIPPYFADLEAAGIVANKFAFLTHRSVPNTTVANETIDQLLADPLNQGIFIMGGGEEQTDLYTGSFVNIDVVDDMYYNTNLKAVQVGDGAVTTALQLAPQDSGMGSNSIVDSGTNSLFLSTDVYQAIYNALGQLNSNFTNLIDQAGNQYIPNSSIDFTAWPPIHFIMSGESGEDIKLTCTPQTYWQINAQPGYALFQINEAQQGSANQSILGLPLMNNYYCVFDRSLDPQGVIRFAAKS